MALVLINKEKSTETETVFGVIELDEGQEFYVAEFDKVPVVPHLPQTYDLFDETETLETLERSYNVSLVDYVLTPLSS
ncbi:hypothetical protein [Dyadobacter sp. CY323]|uniref:hypothetical protein n=1 Tax=Dyadobacter sp. CY323 TaxID=2907302 RepID=UPI001F1A3047|nr:hypothetical protein [Dyadobacter sp. CY323]MCE6988149.1 hypothetical protein [Dyadobacter sp. CY323]